MTTVQPKLKAVVGSNITGDVYLYNVPTDKVQLENFTLNILNNPADYVQDGIMNVNLEMMGLEKGSPNSLRMKQIMDLVFPFFDNTTIENADKSTTLHLDIDDDKGIFKEQNSEKNYLYNLRVRFVTL